MKKLRVGVVGLQRGSVHCANSVASENTELVAVCDIDKAKADRLAGKYGVRAYYDHRELCAADDIDAVIMATPIDVHTETARRRAERRKARDERGHSRDPLSMT